jgi:hypothetical protein
MLRFSLPLLSSLALSSVLFACTAGTTTTSSSSGEPAPKGSSTSATEPPKAGSSGSSDSTAGSALGPACKEYIACCEDLAEENPQVGASCDSVKDQIEKAQKSGVSTSSYESACKSGTSSFKSAGYCK